MRTPKSRFHPGLRSLNSLVDRWVRGLNYATLKCLCFLIYLIYILTVNIKCGSQKKYKFH